MNLIRPRFLFLVTCALVACGNRSHSRPDSTSDDTSGSPSLGVGQPAVVEMAAPSGCAADNLAACEYPSRDLMFSERTGLSTYEPQTGRTLPLVVRMPATSGPLPVVIWMHGGGFQEGGENQSQEWGETFARHGYVALHIGSSPLLTGNVATYCQLASVPNGECIVAATDDESGLLAVGRSYDLKAVLDDLPRLSALNVKAGGPGLDLDRVAVAGWSGGARGPAMVLGARNRPTPGSPVFTNPHPRPVAALFMSPAGPLFGGWFESTNDTSWKELRGPAFTATGTNDVKPDKVDLTGAIRRRSFELQPADGKRILLNSNLAVGVGGHGSFNLGDAGSTDARLDRLSRALMASARAFLDANLRGDAAAKAWLESDDARTLAGDADWQRK